ncbi:MAG TPA: hypothetical protein VJU18_19620 [Vicinamibacteria bacterium]|nr:hypothetical protein [Vicinamibacteria bacterium]
MMNAVETLLSAEEWGLVSSLREVPDSPLRGRLLAFVGELVGFAREPSCWRVQADGAPCATAQVACDQCQQLMSLVEGLRARMRQV